MKNLQELRLQIDSPYEIPLQYSVTVFNQIDPPIFIKKFFIRFAELLGSPAEVDHCEPQKTSITLGFTIAPIKSVGSPPPYSNRFLDASFGEVDGRMELRFKTSDLNDEDFIR